MYLIRWQVHFTICNIISVNADFLSMKELKSICTIRVFLNSNMHTEVVRTNNKLHTHCDLKMHFSFIKSFSSSNKNERRILHKGKILNYNFHFHSICLLIVILLFTFLFVLGQSGLYFQQERNFYTGCLI